MHHSINLPPLQTFTNRSESTKKKYAKDGERQTERGDTQERVLGR